MSEQRTRPCGGCFVCAGRIPADDLTCTSPIVVDEHGNDITIIDQLRQAVAAACALHPTPAELVASHAESDVLCPECICPAPCPTRRALDGEEDGRE